MSSSTRLHNTEVELDHHGVAVQVSDLVQDANGRTNDAQCQWA
jgi:hypothetical protein